MIADGYPDWDGYAQALHRCPAGYPGVGRIVAEPSDYVLRNAGDMAMLEVANRNGTSEAS